jgi:hypothetical protein
MAVWHKRGLSEGTSGMERVEHTWADGGGGGGRSERTSSGSRNGSVQLTKPHLQESARDTIFFVSSLQATNTQLRLSVSKLCHPRWRYPYSLFPLLLLMVIRASLINLLFFILYIGFFILFSFFILQYTPTYFLSSILILFLSSCSLEVGNQ